MMLFIYFSKNVRPEFMMISQKKKTTRVYSCLNGNRKVHKFIMVLEKNTTKAHGGVHKSLKKSTSFYDGL